MKTLHAFSSPAAAFLSPQQEKNTEQRNIKEERERRSRTPLHSEMTNPRTKKINPKPKTTPPILPPPPLAPPHNDCCPICFDDFTVPCRSNCLHWFCASCILEYWRYGASLRPCKCPFCFTRITTLTPQLTLLSSSDYRTVSMLKNVYDYNSLYAGGASAYAMVRALPSVIMRCLLQMSDPGWRHFYYLVVRGIALFLSIIYMTCSFDFIPGGFWNAQRLFQFCGLVFLGFVHLFGFLHRYLQRRRERNLAAFPQ